MSRDTGDGDRRGRIAGDADAEPDTALLTAYVDGVAELSTDERRRISARLARDPGARADEAVVRTVLDRLRALPPEGTEPDWTAMEASIRNAVGREVPRPWWRSWRWLAPAATLATAMVVLLTVWAHPQAIVPATAVPRADLPHAPPADRGDDVVALWLDGDEVDVDLSASDMLGDSGAADDDEPAWTERDDAEPGLLPSAGLAWVDRLDDAAIARAERWLAGAVDRTKG
jgi:hypothetical protein